MKKKITWRREFEKTKVTQKAKDKIGLSKA